MKPCLFLLLSLLLTASCISNNPLSPDRSLQVRIDAANPGDTIILENGIYYGCLVIDKPLTLKARNPGKVLLSNAARTAPTFTSGLKTPGLYSAEVSWPIHWILTDGRALYDYRELEALRSFTVQPQYCRLYKPREGMLEGFVWENGTLYIRLAENADPNDAGVEINGPQLDGRAHYLVNNGLRAMDSFVRPDTSVLQLDYAAEPTSHGLSTELGVLVSIVADSVTLEGLRIHLAPHVGVDIKKGKDIAIRDCFFDGCQVAINTWEECENLTVEYCEFDGGQLYSRFKERTFWPMIYFSSLEANLVCQKGSGFIFRHNLLYEGFDGVQPRGIAPELFDTLPDTPSEISYNVFLNFMDNSLEADGWTRRMDLRIHHNLLIDGRDMLSCAPTQGGPLTVDHNIFYNSPENGTGGMLLKNSQPAAPNSLNTGLTVVHNTFVLPGKYLWEQWYNCEYKDNVIENNIMVVTRSTPWDKPGFTPTKYNLLSGDDVSVDHLPHCLHADPELGRLNPVDFRLAKGSPAIGAGRDGVDLGAIAQGDTWDFPRPGPRWATSQNIPNRPSFPASISPAWGGLAE